MKKITIILGIILVIALVISSSYALFYQENTLDNQERYATGILDIQLVEEEGYNTSIQLNNTLPMSDEEGKNTTPFKLKLKNVGNLSYTFDLKLINTENENSINPDYIKIMVDSDEPTTYSNLNNNTIKTNITLDPNKEIVIEIRVWLNNNILNSEIGKKFSGKLVVDGVGSEYVTESTKTLEKLNLVSNIGNPDFTKIANTDEGIYAAEDDYGTSYYFRGAVENNYVKFGEYANDIYYGYNTDKVSATSDYLHKTYNSLEECQNASDYNKSCQLRISKGTPMYWRIIRINGDGSIRMIYDGTEPHENGEQTYDKIINMSAYNEIGTDLNYAGYMYGNKFFDWDSNSSSSGLLAYYDEFTETGLYTYPTPIEGSYFENINDSKVKKEIDNWYASHFTNTQYEKYLADVIYCNYRKSYKNFIDIAYKGGFDYYDFNYSTPFTSLKCTIQNDRFTVNDTTLGNGDLTYPIGLITIDEVNMAGVLGVANGRAEKNYLMGTGFWTMSPNAQIIYIELSDTNHEANVVTLHMVDVNGATSNAVFNDTTGVRPVISIKGDTNLIGTGTINNPFRLAED